MNDNLIKILLLLTIIAVGINAVSAVWIDEGHYLFNWDKESLIIMHTEPHPIKGSGGYEVGKDIPAGEYYVKCNSRNLYVEINSDSSGRISSIISNLTTKGGVYVTVDYGEYLIVRGGDIYKVEDEIIEQEDGYYTEGQYKVGKDIPAGEYVLEAIGYEGYVEITSDSRHTLDSIITNDFFENDKIITLSDGQYVEFTNAKLKA